MIRNLRNEKEYRLVTDGKQLYRLHPSYKIPKGVHKVQTHFGKNVYNRQGWLIPEFINIQKIQPRNNINKLTLHIRAALQSWQ